MTSFAIRFLLVFGWLVAPMPFHGAVLAQDESSPDDETSSNETKVVVVAPLDEDGRLVRFDRDVAPILRQYCLECHGPEEAKNDFRVDDVDSLMQYVESEDLESSTMYIDYLVTDDEDMLMPPTTHGGPLSAAELALIRVWIEEGADWPEDFELVAESAAADAGPPIEPPEVPKTLGERVWAFQGFLHPATVHFPIAFFLLGALFVVLGWKWPSVGTQVPLACLLLGALSAIGSTLMGWSFAPEQGYGSGWDPLNWGREVDVHRWSGAIVTVLSVFVALVALVALWKDSDKLTSYWKVGLLVLAGMVGAVGHQGGEMSYGADFYPKAFRILLGTTEEEEGDAAGGTPSLSESSDAEGSPDESSEGSPDESSEGSPDESSEG
jgi:uncharacterized membrane protein